VLRLFKVVLRVLLVVLVFSVSAWAQSPNRGRFVSGEILVKFKPGAAASAKAEANRVAGGLAAAEIRRSGLQRVRVRAGQEAAAIARYQRNPNVQYAELNYIRTIPTPLAASGGSPAVPADANFNEQWALHNTGQGFYCIPWFSSSLCFYSGTPDADIDAPEAWALATGTSTVTVAVIDTGVDYTHPDLAPNYAGGYDFVFNDADPMDDHGHGTHVAGTIAAAVDNPTGNPAQPEGVVGVAPHARIKAYKVCRSDGTCDDFTIQQAIARAVEDGVNVINMSLGDTVYSQSLDNAVQDAWNAGLVIVAAAGNAGVTDPLYPAAFDNVISVAAFDEDHRRASFSNYGNWVDMSAPGNLIMSTYPMSQCPASSTPGDTGCYTWLSGTSMATPHVAGAAALVWTRSDVTRNSQVVDILLNSADPIGASNQHLDTWTQHGGLNLYNAMTYVSTKPVADAGADQSLVDTNRDGTEIVTLDGTASFDSNGSIVSYTWTEGGTPLGSGATKVVPLAVGVHKLTLEVTDNDGETSRDTVVVTIYASDPVSVTATTATAAEAGPSNGTFTVVRGGSTDAPLTVHYVVAGTATPGSDYLALPGTVTIDAGSSSATITVAPIDDAAFESGESVVLTVSADAEYSVGSPSQATVTVVSDDLPPDLAVSAASVPATAGADSDIAVTDTTSNQGGGQSAPSQTGFYLSADALLDEADVLLGTRSVPSLNPSAAHTATTTLHLPASTSTGLYYVFAVADWNAGVEESADGETNNVRLPSLVRVGPDLAVTSLTGPSSASPGATIVISDTTANQGGGWASASTTQYFLSLNAVLDAADVLLGGRSVAAIAPGQVNSGSASVTVPSTATSGTYFVIAKADGGSVVAETSEPNNVRAGSMVKIGADLTVTALTVPTKAAAGAAISVTDTTANQGTGDADASSTGFYLSANLLLDASDVLLGNRAVPALAAGASNAWTTSLQIPANTVTGTYYVIANSDVGRVVAESSETNNTKFATLYIGPDLVVTTATAPLSATPGATIVVSDTTANQGGGAAAPSTTQYFLSSNATYEATDVLLGSRPVSGLAAGGSESGSASVVVPSTTPTGVYYVIARADGGSAVPETTETNNTRTSGQMKIGADLVITAGTAPAAAGAGTTIVVSDTTTNQGTGGAGASATGYYLSANALLDGADVQIGSRAVPVLAAGASNSGSASLQIPASTPTGTYYVIAVADAANAVAETLENNNTRLLMVRIGPDLTITAASAAASAVAGTTVAASDTTSNVGGGSAAVSTTYYYLSINAVFDSSDVLIGTRSVGTVAAGASDTGSTTLTVPAGTAAGTYYIVVMADGPQSVPETTEVNNTRAVLFKITGS
jgi:subtilisin family serine protease/subtilase family serine protease